MKMSLMDFELAAFATLIICLVSRIGETKIPSSVLYDMGDIHSITELLISLPITANNGIHISGNRPETTHGRSRGTDQSVVHVYARNQVNSDHRLPDGPSNNVDHGVSITSNLSGEVEFPSLPACEPRATIVRTTSLIAVNDDTIFWPHCLSIQRCGGCCNSDLFECVATETRDQTAELIRMEYRSETMRLEWAGMTSLHFKEDVNCGCKCKVRPSDCRPDRELFTNCQCQCMVELDCPINFRWDPLSCDCVCDVPWSERLCRSKRETFNSTMCGCSCDSGLQEKCERKGLRFNSSKCKCISRSRYSLSDSS
ncbi:vascular endothelial growth factor A-like isoform X3 [Apostichopus japonicus]|uniref:vascular endothelial growth factor A-like isoform X3 n=2 Tax=Stichopus japonicus TaxID=307972 RepID=UPI003AB7E87B